MADYINTDLRLTGSMEIQYIGYDTDDKTVGIYLTKNATDSDGEPVYITNEIKLPLDLFMLISNSVDLAIIKAKTESDEDSETWGTYHLYRPNELGLTTGKK
jgi:hypothetical protein